MKIICNITPFIALSSIDQIPLLKELYGSIQVPQAVIDELKAGGSILVPDIAKYEWIRVVPDITDISNRLIFQLDNGERQVILNALKVQAELVLIDDRVGRNIAEYLLGYLFYLALSKSSFF